MRISQCMIVKNEEKHIERALTWAKDIVDEQIIVDTGSTDRTIEIAKAMGATVYEFEWINDFATAKNEALKYATGDWIIYADADEYMVEEEVQRIYELMKRLPKKYQGIMTAYISVDDEGKAFNDAVQTRFFRRLDGFQYTGRIHEYLACSNGKQPKYYNGRQEYTIWHLGYSPTELERTNKTERNIRMLKAELEIDPDNLHMKSYLAASLLQHGDMEEAREVLFNIIDRDTITMDFVLLHMAYFHLLKSYRAFLNDEYEEEMLAVHEAATSWNSEHPDYDYLVAMWYMAMDNYEKADKYCRIALDKMAVYQSEYPMECSCVKPMLYEAQMIANCRLGKFADALSYGFQALQENRYAPAILCQMLEILKAEAQTPAFINQVLALLTKIYSFQNIKDKVMMYRCAQKAGYPALEMAVYERLTEEDKEIFDIEQKK